jgi:hypothetical protein
VPGDLGAGEAVAAGEEMFGSAGGQEIVDLAEHDLEAVLMSRMSRITLGLSRLTV